MRFSVTWPLAAVCLAGNLSAAQRQAPAAHPDSSAAAKPSVAPISIATVGTQGIAVSGSLSVDNGRAVIGNNGSVTAGDRTADLTLTRGGTLDVCASTKVHLSTDNTTAGGGALMIALDRGALEAHYKPGRYSDVLLTPDLRILISPPGEADLSLRVNNQGDTCIDNHGNHAPYVIVSNLFDGGAYRVQPNQRVLFEHGSLREVVDHETEPCGCPVPLAIAGATSARPARPTAKSAAAENPFPLAESEGLQAPPAPPSVPIVPAGRAHAQVEAPLAYDGKSPAALPPKPEAGSTAAQPQPSAPGAPAFPGPSRHSSGFFHHIGHFFKKLFGG